jgi:hypothetical protein
MGIVYNFLLLYLSSVLIENHEKIKGEHEQQNIKKIVGGINRFTVHHPFAQCTP